MMCRCGGPAVLTSSTESITDNSLQYKESRFSQSVDIAQGCFLRIWLYGLLTRTPACQQSSFAHQGKIITILRSSPSAPRLHPPPSLSLSLSLSLLVLLYLKYMCICSISRISPSWARAGCKKTLCLLHYPRKIKFIHSFIHSLTGSACIISPADKHGVE